jgi:hypothetical protein
MLACHSYAFGVFVVLFALFTPFGALFSVFGCFHSLSSSLFLSLLDLDEYLRDWAGLYGHSVSEDGAGTSI